MGIKSPSLVSFGQPLQELTLNKQGKIPQGKQKINPKDLSNEELEYIIKTG